MALPKRAASALTAAEPDPRPHQARAQHCPCRNEVHEVDRSHGRDAGPDEPEGEEEKPQAETGEDAEQGAFAAGQYCREFDSIAATPGTWAAKPADWMSDAPGHVRSCTHRNMPNFWSAAAIKSDWLFPLHAFSAAPV